MENSVLWMRGINYLKHKNHEEQETILLHKISSYLLKDITISSL